MYVQKNADVEYNPSWRSNRNRLRSCGNTAMQFSMPMNTRAPACCYISRVTPMGRACMLQIPGVPCSQSWS